MPSRPTALCSRIPETQPSPGNGIIDVANHTIYADGIMDATRAYFGSPGILDASNAAHGPGVLDDGGTYHSSGYFDSSGNYSPSGPGGGAMPVSSPIAILPIGNTANVIVGPFLTSGNIPPVGTITASTVIGTVNNVPVTPGGTLQTSGGLDPAGYLAYVPDTGDPLFALANPVNMIVSITINSVVYWWAGGFQVGNSTDLCARSDIENFFGIPNVIKWAILSGQDPTSVGGLAEVANRVEWSIGLSSTEFRNAMRQGGYQLPLDGADAIVWQTNVVAAMAGLFLYEHLRPTQRGEDGRPVPSHYDGIFTWAMQELNFVRSRKKKLDGTPAGKGCNAPFVTHERSRGAYGPGIGGYGGPPMNPDVMFN